MKSISTEGLIYIDDKGLTYKIAKIQYIEYEDGQFKYLFTPYYSVVDLAPDTIYQGIPGLNMSKRKEVYERNNIIPVFISERTPSKNRENLRELLEECGMTYLNQLEWLIRTYYTYAGDHFEVKRYDANRDESKTIEIESIFDLSNQTKLVIKKILDIICYGNNLKSREINIDDSNRKEMYQFLVSLYENDIKTKRDRQRYGIDLAKDEGKYKGRQKINIDILKMQDVLNRYISGEITEEKAIHELGISRATFFRRLKEYKSNN